MNDLPELRDRPKTYDKSLNGPLLFETGPSANRVVFSNASLEKPRPKKMKKSFKKEDEKFKNIYQMGIFTKLKPKNEMLLNNAPLSERLYDFKDTLKNKMSFSDRKNSHGISNWLDQYHLIVRWNRGVC